jgi:hypothetical protein
MELAEWRERIEAKVQQDAGAAPLSIRGAKRMIAVMKRQDKARQENDNAVANLVEERKRDIAEGKDPDEPVNKEVGPPRGKPRDGDDPMPMLQAIAGIGEIARKVTEGMTKAQRRAFYRTITAEWLPQCDAETVARCLLKAWSLDDVDRLIGGLQRMRDGAKAAPGDKPQEHATLQ